MGASKDTMLSLDPGSSDCLYRIHRAFGSTNRVVYVTLTDTSIIPEDSSTFGPWAIAELRKLTERSDQSWSTLLVHKDKYSGNIYFETDKFRPHSVSKEHLRFDKFPSYDLFSLTEKDSLNHRVSEVVLQDGRTCFLKIARFPHKVSFVKRELQAYHCLAKRNAELAPKLIGYVFEESTDRVIGFLAEAIHGRTPGPTDFLSLKLKAT